MANGIVCVALTAPFALFVIRKSPKEREWRPLERNA